MLLHLGHSPEPANFRTHDSSPETLTPEGNKSRVSGVGVELNSTRNTDWLCWWQLVGQGVR